MDEDKNRISLVVLRHVGSMKSRDIVHSRWKPGGPTVSLQGTLGYAWTGNQYTSPRTTLSASAYCLLLAQGYATDCIYLCLK